MISSDIDGYESWNLVPLELPQRSRLYHLEPIGVGTPLVECLTGYIVRLAEDHSVPVMTLVAKEIAPKANAPYLSEKELRGFNKFSRMINGFGVVAKTFKAVVESLTLRSDLISLTMLPWEKVMTNKNLLRQSQAWCPQCYEDWKIARTTVYLPLLWTLNVITICPVHGQYLVTACPCCNHSQYFIDSYSRAGYCGKCGSWLGRSADDVNSYDSETHEDFNERVWVARSLGALFEVAPRIVSPPTREKVASSLTKCIEQVSQGNTYQFARYVELNKNLLGDWRTGRHIPQLNYLARICFKTGIPFVDLLLKEPVAERLALPAHHSNKCKKRKKVDKDLIAKVLDEAIKENPPPTVRKISKRLQYSASKLYKYYPEQCRLISIRFSEYKNETYAKKWNSVESKILAALEEKNTPVSIFELAIGLACHVSALYRRFPRLCSLISERHKSHKFI